MIESTIFSYKTTLSKVSVDCQIRCEVQNGLVTKNEVVPLKVENTICGASKGFMKALKVKIKI